MYPNVGSSIPGIEEMDLQKVINAIYGKDSDQHTFMYEHMVKTMQNILSQLKDKLTTPKRRNELIDLTNVFGQDFEYLKKARHYIYSLSWKSKSKKNI